MNNNVTRFGRRNNMKKSLTVKNPLYLSLIMLVLLALVAWTTRAQGQSSNLARQARTFSAS
jgi:hypothetical protein